MLLLSPLVLLLLVEDEPSDRHLFDILAEDDSLLRFSLDVDVTDHKGENRDYQLFFLATKVSF